MASDDGRIYVARHDTEQELKNLLKINDDMEEVKERLTIIEQKIDKILGSKPT
jgi:tetrahydromethanopterin S-methyltransferase subunit G